MATNKEAGIADEVLDQLLAGREPGTVFATGGLVDELKKRLAERMLNGEMDHHLGAAEQKEAGNHRNGSGAKTVLTDTGKLELAISPGSARALRAGVDRRVSPAVRGLRRQDHRAVSAEPDDP
jgi:hypothetical protein